MIKQTLLAGALAFASVPAHAAAITVIGGGVYLTGKIEANDNIKFFSSTVTAHLPKGTKVYLDSLGGDVGAGLGIANTIRAEHYETVVERGKTCASMCGLIWLAGAQRWWSPDAHIGFHAIYETGTKAISATGNAVVGAYLARLGFSEAAVRYFTQASPDSMTWLTQADAFHIGLAYNSADVRGPRNFIPPSGPSTCPIGEKWLWNGHGYECMKQYYSTPRAIQLDNPNFSPRCSYSVGGVCQNKVEPVVPKLPGREWCGDRYCSDREKMQYLQQLGKDLERLRKNDLVQREFDQWLRDRGLKN